MKIVNRHNSKWWKISQVPQLLHLFESNISCHCILHNHCNKTCYDLLLQNAAIKCKMSLKPRKRYEYDFSNRKSFYDQTLNLFSEACNVTAMVSLQLKISNSWLKKSKECSYQNLFYFKNKNPNKTWSCYCSLHSKNIRLIYWEL